MIMLRKISLASVGITVGASMTVAGILAYIFENATINLFGFTYGIPILLGGLAFKITELKPVPVTQPASDDVIALRDTQATEIQKQVYRDVTRYWYGQDAHLYVSLRKIGMGRSDDEQPTLTGVYETAIDGAYALVLEFDSTTHSLADWQERQAKIDSFFGPGIQSQLSQPEEDRIVLSLITQAATDAAPAEVATAS